MIIDGINLIEGSSITNLTVASGTAYPSGANAGELFFRTDAPNIGLYAYDGTSWASVGGGSSYTAGTGITLSGSAFSLTSGIVTASTYKSITVDTYGRVTAGTNPTTLTGYGITDAAPIASPTFTGTPTAPTATAATNTTQIATTAFVTAAVTAGGGGGGSITVADDVATAATYYPTFSTVTSGTLSTIKTSSTQLTYTPNTGTLFATNYSSSSDINLKENIVDIVNGLSVINNLSPKTFTWKDNGSVGYGVIAQELEVLLPALVSTSADTGLKSVNYDGLIGFLISAVQELSTKVQRLQE